MGQKEGGFVYDGDGDKIWDRKLNESIRPPAEIEIIESIGVPV